MFTGGLDCTQKTSAMNFGKNTYTSAAVSCTWHAPLQAAVHSDGLKRFDGWVGYSRDSFSSYVNIIQNILPLIYLHAKIFLLEGV